MFYRFCAESDNVDAAPSRTVNHRCRRTVADEEFLLVRFQVFCLLTGTIAFVSVRKQKAAAASLFDQRKLNLQKRRTADSVPIIGGSGGTGGGTSVEMTATNTTSASYREEETRALMSSSDTDGLDVV